MNLFYKPFYYCQGITSTQMINPLSMSMGYIGLESDFTKKGDLLKDPSAFFLTGIAISEGVYNVVIRGQLNAPSTISTWLVMTYRILGDSNPR